ncbi:ATP-dependent endonuclease [Promicromonospora vindobonensis]|uniref:ATP-dependent endonuclease n=1 Tax=Promicromonospora vindobonensis TaxID=195748 RepID=A0ABW5VNQ5_9MICO
MVLTQTQASIESKFSNGGDFVPYIEEIRFPMYKSLEDGLTLRLNWPIVALIGPNGTNKSSVLQAISAAPEGRSLAQFWFSTAVDDIDRGVRDGATHRFVYKYRFDNSGTSAECRKYRGSKQYRAADVPKALRGKRDPDYWEPTKRVARDGMAEIPATGFDSLLSKNRDRWNQIKKNVVYLDFRSELSAFDKYIHHQSFNHWTPDATQKRYKAVLQSKWIAKALEGLPLPKGQAGQLIEQVRDLAQPEVETVAKILGKPIESIAMIEHRFFGPTGYTMRLRLEATGAAYSEAHAGSGEYAVVRLVDAIRRAPQRSLILLDEPEVSLHPGAQAELLRFIESEVRKHGHQVVMSTHSPSLAAGLPPQAIKVLGFDTNRQRVVLLADGCSPTEAFAHLGHTTAGPTRPRLIVEDELAAEMVRASLRRHATTKLDTLEIVPFPGGADGIVKNVLSTLALAGVQKAGILLDGDQLPTTASTACDVKSGADAAKAASDLDGLKRIWAEQFHKTPPNLHSNSGGGTNVKTLHLFLLWADDHLGFFPGRTPEEAIATAANLARAEPGRDWKAFWVDKVKSDLHLTANEVVTAEQILQSQQAEVAGLPADSSLLKEIHETVGRILDW